MGSLQGRFICPFLRWIRQCSTVEHSQVRAVCLCMQLNWPFSVRLMQGQSAGIQPMIARIFSPVLQMESQSGRGLQGLLKVGS